MSTARTQVIFAPSLDRPIKEVIIRGEETSHVRLARMGGAYGAVYEAKNSVPEKRTATFSGAEKTPLVAAKVNEDVSDSIATACLIYNNFVH